MKQLELFRNVKHNYEGFQVSINQYLLCLMSLWTELCALKFRCGSPNAQYNCFFWRQGFQDVTKVQLSHKGGALIPQDG